ncbi:MAG: OmpP1/FadL family transporter [Myxococcota bacterium]
MWLALLPASQASPVEIFGFGARKMGRAGGGVAVDDGAENVLLNPAALAGRRYPEVSLGFVGAGMRFSQLPPLWWDTNRDGLVNEADPALELADTYDPVQAVILGATRPIGPTIGVGFGLLVPVQRILRLATFEPALPTYFMYANRVQSYELGLGAAWRPWGGLSVGAGVSMIPRARYSLDATLDLTLSGASEGDADASDVVGMGLDVHAMQLDLIPGFAPRVALHWDAGQAVPALDGLTLGASWRGEAGLPVDVDIDLQIDAATEDTGDLDPMVLPFLLGVQLGVYDHYVPEQWVAGAAYTLLDTATISGEVRFTRWDRMQVSIARVVDSSVEGAAVDFGEDPLEDGNPYAITMEPTVSPRLGLDLRLPGVQTGDRFGEVRILARGGFGYEPTPLATQSAASALLDSDRVIFSVGAGLEHDDPFRRTEDRRVRLDGYFQYHLLATGELVRPEPQTPTPGYPVAGSSLPIGGHLLAAGLQWSLEY